MIDRSRCFVRDAIFVLAAAVVSLWVSWGQAAAAPRTIVTSDTILAGIIEALLPPDRYRVEAILPPNQCPGHYDIKLSDVQKTQKAALLVSFRGMPFMKKASSGGAQLLVDAGGRNWMRPDVYVDGLNLLAEELAARFPRDRDAIAARRQEAMDRINAAAAALLEKIRQAGLQGRAVLASRMQKEPLEWMGFSVAGAYGRPEAISAREIVRLTMAGRRYRAVAVVDNLQSGPDAGKGIAEALGVVHLVLTNFPSAEGYLATLEANVDAVLAALAAK